MKELFLFCPSLPHIFFIDQSTHDDKMRRANAAAPPPPIRALLEGNNVTWRSSHCVENVSQFQKCNINCMVYR
jgi:hypothetical protein